MIKDDEDMLKLFERMPDYLICEDKIAKTAAVLKVDHVCVCVCVCVFVWGLTNWYSQSDIISSLNAMLSTQGGRESRH